ncbi:hypothetical protein GGU11DRAFT_785870 [Lentinula aff. detonsa]|uniref:F-box domain-containing protein n=1 Tax=Lentinula aff. detonsa TaxID=2804958 RepID=A0AA38L628_9AGAR|nr:hypothetical protein GGU10DRAFT_108073 [Lentinula aff. detonsa]KAJ3797130.1 hypothetical protein GGU11DRAFT_785870 [Lentinula aff. detonsa]
MSLPAVTAHIVEPISTSNSGGPLDAAVEELSAALTQIKVIISDTTSEIAEETHTSKVDEVVTVRVRQASFCDLPSEILLAIFSYACQVGESWEALSFSLVCGQWRALMLADPNLWSNIALIVSDLFPNPTPSLSFSALLRMAKLTLLYLERSEDCMLSVTVKMPTRFRGLNANWQSYISVGAINFLQRNSHRIKHLHLRTDHGLLHAFAYEEPCLVDSGHDQPCSDTIPLPHLISLSVEYVSRHRFYFPFQRISRLKHLALGNEGLIFQKSPSQTVPSLTFPRLTRLVVSEPSSFHQFCRTMTLINALPRIKQVILKQIPRLADLSISRQQVILQETSLLKISESSDAFLSTFCRVYQFSGLKAFELDYDIAERSSASSSTAVAWTDLVCDIVYFIRRCPMIQTITVRNARESCYPRANDPGAQLVEEVVFEPQISPNVHIIGFPIDGPETEGPPTARAMMEFFRGFELK